LGDTEEIEKVSEEPISAPSTAPETPQVTAPPQELHELEQPVEAMKPPISPTVVLEWKEDKLPDWLKEISETAPSEAVPAPTQLPPTEEVPVIATKEPVGEAPLPFEEKLSAEVPAISEEIPATEVTPLAEEQAQIEQPITAETELIAEAPAIQAEEIPEWIKGLGETEEIEKVSEEPILVTSIESETPKVTEPPLGQHEVKQPAEAMIPPMSPTGALEWKEEELPAWLKEITETIPDEEAAATIEALPIENIPAIPVEESSVPTEMIAPQVEIGEKIQEEPQPVTGPWVPEVEAPVLAAPVIPVEAEAGPVPVMEELTTKTVEPTPPIPTEQAEMPVEMVSAVDEVALTDARNAISQGQPSQAIGFYKELIKHNYHLGEIIRDLQDALYRFPVNVDMWVTLGDAHNRSDDLQEALNAYTKAEELVR
jgi:hypothetical protein